MPKKDTLPEKSKKIIEWGSGTDFKGQLEYMAKYCGWDMIAIYAASQHSVQSDGAMLSAILEALSDMPRR